MQCEYGCGRVALYPPKKGRRKWCCCSNYRKCPAFVEKVKQKNIGKKRSDEAKNNLSRGRKNIKNKKPLYLNNNSTITCSFGCNNLARYYFTVSKNYCCSDHTSKCPANKKRRSKVLVGHAVSNETKNKISEKITMLNITNEEYKIKQSNSRKYKAKDYKSKYPFFSKVEAIRDNPITNQIEVHCKNHNCPNSKEKGGWFTPTSTQLYERIRQLEKNNGNSGSYFYCCDACKNDCPLFNIHSDPYQTNNKLYTQEEYQTFRDYVLKRDNYKCQYCGAKAEQVHHERPQKLEPFFVLDPDLAWSVCKKCHFKYGHKNECSTGKLATIVC